MTNAARDLIERMKAANAKGNFGLPDGIVAEWIATQEATKRYTRLIDPTTNTVLASV